MSQYEDDSFLGTDKHVLLRGQYNIDAGRRFYGVGPNTPKSAEGNYKEKYWQYQWGVGTPLTAGSAWRARVSQRYQAEQVLDGPLTDLPSFRGLYPTDYSERFQQTDETRLSLLYDTRDHAVTTSRGAYLETYAEAAVRGLLSQYDYERYGMDARWFKPNGDGDSRVFAIQGAYEQILGKTPPFWLLPSLGGKYSLRAYSEGRYVDRGVATLNAEERFKVFEAKTAGVTTEFQVAPFAGVGTVFDSPGRMAGRYLRPVVGTAIRAVARPQVVGSVDFGVGREGLSVFMDINYSF
jgi:outer membrane protein assembly factor BamA